MLQKYIFPLVGLGFLILGLLTCFHVFTDISAGAGIAMSIVGVLIIVYFLFRNNRSA